jgi:hypothetical protein
MKDPLGFEKSTPASSVCTVVIQRRRSTMLAFSSFQNGLTTSQDDEESYLTASAKESLIKPPLHGIIAEPR